jgi:leader peptidase (prepilin peptidase) / N-methyltransferase
VTAVLVVVCAAAGLAVGSALLPVIRRVPDKLPVRGGYACDQCDAPIPWSGRVPVLAWAGTRRRCVSCGEATPGRRVAVEVVTAVAFAAAALKFEWSWALPAYLLFFTSLIAVSVIDLDHFRIPNRIVYPMLVVSVPLLALVTVLEADDWEPFTDALIGAGIGFGFLLLVHLVYPAGMGFGDVKLSALLGLYLGWLGLGHVPLGLFLGFLLGAVIGVGLLVTKVRGRSDPIPFGPFLAAGAVVGVLWGEAILDWYLPS